MKQRVMNPVIPEDLGRKMTLVCMICNKGVEGFYARFGDKGTCSKLCMIEQDKKPKYPDHTEEEYLKRLGETMDVDDILTKGE